MSWLDKGVGHLYGAWASAAETRKPRPEAPPAPPPSDERLDIHIGAGVAQLLVHANEWVWRRTETFEFLSASTARRQMGIDFAVPRVSAGRISVQHVRRMVEAYDRRKAPLLVPLLTLAKAPLTNVDVFDEERQTLPLLTTAQNGRIAGDALVAVALLVASDQGVKVFEETAASLRAIARLPPDEANLLLRCLRDGLDRHRAALAAYGPNKNADLYGHVIKLDERPDALVNAAQLLDDDLLRELTQQLANDFIVLVPLSGDAYARRVFKFAYEEPLSVPRIDDDLSSKQRRAERRRRALRELAERCSWRPKRFLFPGINVGTTQSYHVELIAPENTDIVRGVFDAFWKEPPDTQDESAEETRGATARLLQNHPVGGGRGTDAHTMSERPPVDHTDDGLKAVPGPAVAPLEVPLQASRSADAPAPSKDDPPAVDGARAIARVADENPRRGHMQLSGLPAGATGRAWVQLHASPTGFLNAAFPVTTLIAIIFFAGLTRMDNTDEADAAAAILLSVPTLLAAYIARPGEHEVVSLMLSGVRMMVVASGLVLFTGAAAIAFGYKADGAGNGPLDDIWAWLRWPALLFAGGVAWAWVVVHWPLAAPRRARTCARFASPYIVVAACVAVGAAVLDFRDDRSFGSAWRHLLVPAFVAVVGAAAAIGGWWRRNGTRVRRRPAAFARRSDSSSPPRRPPR